MIPLILYFLLLFFSEKKNQFLWYAGISFVISFIGNLMYFGIPWIVLFFIILLILIIKDWETWKSLGSFSPQNLLSFLGFLVLTLLYFGSIFAAFENIEISLGGRDSGNFKANLGIFLEYGGRGQLQVLAHMFLTGWPVFTTWSGPALIDNTFYIGLLPLPFLLYGVAKHRSTPFLAIGGATIFLIWLASFRASRSYLSHSRSFLFSTPQPSFWDGKTFSSDHYKLVLFSKGIPLLSKSRKRRPEEDAVLAKVLGWDTSKFSFITHPVYVDSQEEGIEMVGKTESIDVNVILRGVPVENRPPPPDPSSSEKEARITLMRGEANIVEVEVEAHSAGWLIYSDSTHPAWKATVNEKEELIAEANLAFKAVALKKGTNLVRFTFGGWYSWLASSLVWIGFAFSLGMSWWFLRTLFSRRENLEFS